MNSFSAHIYTGNKGGAGSNGWVYVGLCGREFSADANGPDFERNANFEYIFGAGSNVLFSDRNDPRHPDIKVEDLDKFPVYIRFEPNGADPEWNLKKVDLKVNGTIVYNIDFGTDGLWLQQEACKMAYLKKTT